MKKLILSIALMLPAVAMAEAVCEPWSDTLARWDGERSDVNVLTCTAPEDCKTKMDNYMKEYGKNRTSGEAYKSYQSFSKCKFVKPPPTCTMPKPTDLTRTQACPAGTVGTFPQTQDYVPAAYPTCWLPSGVWTPTSSSSCVIPPPPEGPELGPNPPLTWIVCGNENTRCAFSGDREVSYGVGTRWTKARTFASGVDCSNSVFGDPAPGTVKRCFRSPDPILPGTGTAKLEWEDKRNPTGLVKKWNVKQASVLSGPWATIAELPDNTMTFTVTGLRPGVYYWTVTGSTSSGVESAPADIVTKQVE